MDDNQALYQGSTVAELYRSAFKGFAEREALVGGATRWSYRQLEEACHRMVRCFRQMGLRRQDGIAVLATNRPESVAAIIASHLMGLRYTPLHPLGSEEDQAFVLVDADVKALVVDLPRHEARGLALARRGLVAHLLTLGPAPFGTDLLAASAGFDGSDIEIDVRPDDVLKIAYSGGTTGKSKGIVHHQRTVVTSALQQLAGWEWPAEVRFLAATPVSHAAGAMILTTLLQGGSVHLLERYTPEAFLATVEAERITASFLVPTQIYGLLDSPALDRHDAASLGLVLYGAAPMAPARLRQALERFGPVFGQVYGQAEAPMTISYLRRDEHDLAHPQRLGSCGRSLPGNQVRLLDAEGREVAVGEIGELCVRGPLVMSGYLDRPEETAKAFAGGWLHTGDMARRDAEGFLYLVDRAKDMIISGGFNVYSSEVENCLAQHPAVALSAVIGVPHDKWGEAVMAVVVLKEGAAAGADELVAFVSARKGVVNAPKVVEFVPALPLTALDKVDKKALRGWYAPQGGGVSFLAQAMASRYGE
ncbi:AMP-binding protein [Variovorax saccharolyticus]|uniref:AMP-binding protein n=1 Tax=Variovorax saccharolyticus TaxID=3053516 RepID=UPI00257683AD|nr:AMP-binding protein [Variovorax sp. J22R187]MDM0021154.1 AMP-binding protein [Variovorax sp. J22R187]